LNQEIINQLKDIQEYPFNIGTYLPLGWAIIIMFILALVLTSGYFLYKKQQRMKIFRPILSQLANINKEYKKNKNLSAALLEYNRVFKTCLKQQGYQETLHLSGTPWLKKLQELNIQVENSIQSKIELMDSYDLNNNKEGNTVNSIEVEEGLNQLIHSTSQWIKKNAIWVENEFKRY